MDGIPKIGTQDQAGADHLSEAIKQIYAPPGAPSERSPSITLHGGKEVEFGTAPGDYSLSGTTQGMSAWSSKIEQQPPTWQKIGANHNPAYAETLATGALSSTSASLAMARGSRLNYATAAVFLGTSSLLDLNAYRSAADLQNHNAAGIGLASDGLLAAGIVSGLAGRGRVGLGCLAIGLAGKVASALMYEPKL